MDIQRTFNWTNPKEPDSTDKLQYNVYRKHLCIFPFTPDRDQDEDLMDPCIDAALDLQKRGQAVLGKQLRLTKLRKDFPVTEYPTLKPYFQISQKQKKTAPFELKDPVLREILGTFSECWYALTKDKMAAYDWYSLTNYMSNERMCEFFLDALNKTNNVFIEIQALIGMPGTAGFLSTFKNMQTLLNKYVDVYFVFSQSKFEFQNCLGKSFLETYACLCRRRKIVQAYVSDILNKDQDFADRSQNMYASALHKWKMHSKTLMSFVNFAPLDRNRKRLPEHGQLLELMNIFDLGKDVRSFSKDACNAQIDLLKNCLSAIKTDLDIDSDADLKFMVRRKIDRVYKLFGFVPGILARRKPNQSILTDYLDLSKFLLFARYQNLPYTADQKKHLKDTFFLGRVLFTHITNKRFAEKKSVSWSALAWKHSKCFLLDKILFNVFIWTAFDLNRKQHYIRKKQSFQKLFFWNAFGDLFFTNRSERKVLAQQFKKKFAEKKTKMKKKQLDRPQFNGKIKEYDVDTKFKYPPLGSKNIIGPMLPGQQGSAFTILDSYFKAFQTYVKPGLQMGMFQNVTKQVQAQAQAQVQQAQVQQAQMQQAPTQAQMQQAQQAQVQQAQQAQMQPTQMQQAQTGQAPTQVPLQAHTFEIDEKENQFYQERNRSTKHSRKRSRKRSRRRSRRRSTNRPRRRKRLSTINENNQAAVHMPYMGTFEDRPAMNPEIHPFNPFKCICKRVCVILVIIFTFGCLFLIGLGDSPQLEYIDRPRTIIVPEPVQNKPLIVPEPVQNKPLIIPKPVQQYEIESWSSSQVSIGSTIGQDELIEFARKHLSFDELEMELPPQFTLLKTKNKYINDCAYERLCELNPQHYKNNICTLDDYSLNGNTPYRKIIEPYDDLDFIFCQNLDAHANNRYENPCNRIPMGPERALCLSNFVPWATTFAKAQKYVLRPTEKTMHELFREESGTLEDRLLKSSLRYWREYQNDNYRLLRRSKTYCDHTKVRDIHLQDLEFFKSPCCCISPEFQVPRTEVTVLKDLSMETIENAICPVWTTLCGHSDAHEYCDLVTETVEKLFTNVELHEYLTSQIPGFEDAFPEQQHIFNLDNSYEKGSFKKKLQLSEYDQETVRSCFVDRIETIKYNIRLKHLTSAQDNVLSNSLPTHDTAADAFHLNMQAAGNIFGHSKGLHLFKKLEVTFNDADGIIYNKAIETLAKFNNMEAIEKLNNSSIYFKYKSFTAKFRELFNVTYACGMSTNYGFLSTQVCASYPCWPSCKFKTLPLTCPHPVTGLLLTTHCAKGDGHICPDNNQLPFVTIPQKPYRDEIQLTQLNPSGLMPVDINVRSAYATAEMLDNDYIIYFVGKYMTVVRYCATPCLELEHTLDFERSLWLSELPSQINAPLNEDFKLNKYYSGTGIKTMVREINGGYVAQIMTVSDCEKWLVYENLFQEHVIDCLELVTTRNVYRTAARDIYAWDKFSENWVFKKMSPFVKDIIGSALETSPPSKFMDLAYSRVSVTENPYDLTWFTTQTHDNVARMLAIHWGNRDYTAYENVGKKDRNSFGYRYLQILWPKPTRPYYKEWTPAPLIKGGRAHNHPYVPIVNTRGQPIEKIKERFDNGYKKFTVQIGEHTVKIDNNVLSIDRYFVKIENLTDVAKAIKKIELKKQFQKTYLNSTGGCGCEGYFEPVFRAKNRFRFMTIQHVCTSEDYFEFVFTKPAEDSMCMETRLNASDGDEDYIDDEIRIEDNRFWQLDLLDSFSKSSFDIPDDFTLDFNIDKDREGNTFISNFNFDKPNSYELHFNNEDDSFANEASELTDSNNEYEASELTDSNNEYDSFANRAVEEAYDEAIAEYLREQAASKRNILDNILDFLFKNLYLYFNEELDFDSNLLMDADNRNAIGPGESMLVHVFGCIAIIIYVLASMRKK